MKYGLTLKGMSFSFLGREDLKVISILVKPLIGLKLLKERVIQNEPVVIKGSVLRGSLKDETLSLEAMAGDEAVPITLHRIGDEFMATVRFSSPGIYSLSLADPSLTLEREVSLVVASPTLRIQPAEITITSEEFEKGTTVTVGSDLYGPDVAAITVSADCEALQVEPSEFELSEGKKEEILRISARGVSLWRRILRRGTTCSLKFTDKKGLLSPATMTVRLEPAMPIGIYCGFGSLLLALIFTPVALKRRRKSAKKGEELVFRNKATIGWGSECDLVLPRRPDIGRLHCSIRKTDDSFILKDEAGLGTYINGRKAQMAELKSGDLIRVGGHEFEFLKLEDGFRIKVLKGGEK